MHGVNIKLIRSLFILIGVYMIWFILLTAIGLAPGGSSTVHICTQIVHRTQWNRIHRTDMYKNKSK